MSESPSPDAKVMFRTARADGSVDVETPWATHLGNDHYAIDNSLWYAYGVSWQDVVYAPLDEQQGFAVFQHVVKKSGHRTIRVLFPVPVSPADTSDTTLQGLVALGCSYEGAWGTRFSIDVPPDTDLDAVRSFLIAENVQWEHADPDYDTLFPGP